MIEVWKKIPNCDGYEVSNLGRIKSLPKFKKNRYSGFLTNEKIFSDFNIQQNYKVFNIDYNGHRRLIKVHQLVAMAFLNHIPCGMELVVDHINNDSLDNRLENLQIISNRINVSKDKKNKTSKYTGVRWHKKGMKWSAQIYFNGKCVHLGLFINEEDANLAYQNKLKQIL